MTAQEFIDWVQTANNLPNPTQAVKRAAQMMRVTEDTVWKWVNAKKPRPTPEYMQLLMELLHEKYREKRFHRILSREQREEMRSMLGKKTDREIAAELGISRFTVQAERYKLGIKKHRSPDGSRVQYDDEFIATLGKIPDFECAKKFGYSNSSVARIRKKYGIAPYQGPRKPRGVEQKPRKPYKPRDPREKKEYPEELIQMLGKVSDTVIGDNFGYSRAGIALIRKKRGIPPFRETRYSQHPYKEILSMLGKAPDEEIAEKFGITVLQAVNYRKSLRIKKFNPHAEQEKMALELLGKYSDYEIARKTGCPVSRVFHIRKKHGITPAPRTFFEKLSLEKREEILSLLGKETDKEIAKKFNVYKAAIGKLRKRMGISPLKREEWRQKNIERNKSLEPLLGTVPDKDLAEKTGLSERVIGNMRRKLKIPAFGKKRWPKKA